MHCLYNILIVIIYTFLTWNNSSHGVSMVRGQWLVIHLYIPLRMASVVNHFLFPEQEGAA